MSSSPSETTLRFLAAPGDVGRIADTVDSGRVLEWIDKAAYAQAAVWGGTYAVTAYVGNIRFRRAIRSGELVEVTARLVHTGRTSMHIQCEVWAADPVDRDRDLACECLTVFIAMADGPDGSRRPSPVPTWEPQSSRQVDESETAVRRAELRAEIEEAMAGQRYTDAGTAPELVLRFLASPGDVNWGGNVHGGVAMRWIDEAANLCATRWAEHVTTSVYAGGVRFYRPIHIGQVVEVRARLLHTGDETMHVSVHVSSGDPTSDERELTTHCLTVCSPIDSDGRPMPVRAWEPVSEEDRALDRHAVELIDLRRRGQALGRRSERDTDRTRDPELYGEE